MNRSTKTRLGMDTLEVRECPALLVGGDDHCGTPWPPPRPLNELVAVSRVSVAANPVAAHSIIAINPVVTQGFIIQGG